MAKFGAAIAQGLIDAGGRNSTISMQSKSGSINISAVVGMTLFTQFWFWYPLVHCISLSFTPTSLIGLDSEFRIPEMKFISNAKKSTFDYVQMLKIPTKDPAERVATAVLSTTAKAQARHNKAKKEKEGEETMMEVEESNKENENEEKEEKEKQNENVIEEDYEVKDNLTRVTPNQVPFITFSSDGRYTPIRSVSQVPQSTKVNDDSGSNTPISVNRRTRRPTISSIYSSTPRSASGGGILILQDHRKGEPNTFIDLKASENLDSQSSQQQSSQQNDSSSTLDNVDDGEELNEIPEPFEYDFENR